MANAFVKRFHIEVRYKQSLRHLFCKIAIIPFNTAMPTKMLAARRDGLKEQWFKTSLSLFDESFTTRIPACQSTAFSKLKTWSIKIKHEGNN